MRLKLCAALLPPLAFALVGSAALAAPAVTVSPGGDHPKGSTKVSGTGFGVNEAVDIYFDTTDEVLAATNASGKFGPDILTVPATALPGTHWITAIGRKDGIAAQHAFNVRTLWAEHGFNARGQSRNPFENVIDAGNAGNLDLAWSTSTPPEVFDSAAVANIAATYDPYVFFGSEDGNLYAYDATGKLEWKRATGGAIYSSPAIAGSSVYVGSADGKLYALNATTGAIRWSTLTTAGDSVSSSPAVANGIVYVGSDDAKLYAFHASDGTPAWSSPAVTGGMISFSSPVVADGVVSIGSSDGKLYAFDAKTGASAWAAPFVTGAGISSKPAVAAGTVFFGSEDHLIYAVTAKTGVQQWSVTTSNGVLSSPAVANGVVYIGSEDGKLYAINASSGSILWTGTTGGRIGWSGAAIANGVVFIGNYDDGKMYAFDAKGCGAATCSPLWTAATGNPIGSTPAISDGMLYFGAYDGSFYAYALDAGNNAAYRFRKPAPPPSYSTLHPDMRLKPVRH